MARRGSAGGSFDTLGWLFRDLRDGPLLAKALFDLDVPEFAETRARIGCVAEEFIGDCEPNVRQGFADWQTAFSRTRRGDCFAGYRILGRGNGYLCADSGA